MREYVIEHGDVWLREVVTDTGRRSPVRGLTPLTHVCDGTGMLAVAFDAEDGTLHKTGKAEDVSAWAAVSARKFADSGFDAIAGALTVVSFPISPETVAELNALRATTGRVLRLTERLSEIAEACPELLDRPTYPPAASHYGMRGR